MTLAPGRLLLVDDNAVDRELIRRCIGSFCETLEAATGGDALELLRTANPDCALIDYYLPDVDGLALLPTFLARNIPVVMLTGQGDETLAVEAMKRGAEDYLAKARLDPETLRRAVLHAIEKKTMQQRIERQQVELRARVAEVERQQGELVQSNAALRERETKLRIVLEQLPAIVWATDSELRCTSIGGLRWRSLGADPQQLIGAPIEDAFTDQAARQAMVSAHHEALAGRRAQFEVALGVAPHQAYVEALHDEAGRVIGVVGMAIDVSGTRLLEQQLRVAQKMEALGKLAGGIAHDFNNILTVILSFTALAREALPPGLPARSDLDEVISAADRAAQMVSQLLTFSRHGSAEPSIVHVGEVLSDMMSMLRRLLGEEIEIRAEIAADLWNTCIAVTSLEQVILNLVVNARDAMPRGGHIALEVSNASFSEATLVGGSRTLGPGEYVVLAVNDDGSGIAPELQEQIFDPFFTTKGPGEGTGLGLATCYGIVGQAGGEIAVYSKLGHGTTFKVYLPRSMAPTNPAKTETEASGAKGDETILVVEDEAQVRALAVRVLRARGYNVLEAGRPSLALQLCHEYPNKIHLLLSDVVMPEMTGPELAVQIRELRPGIAVLYMSGYSNSVVRERGLAAADEALLDKPFTPAALEQRVREALAASAQATTRGLG